MSSVLILGSTGYIGAPFVTALRQKYHDIKITAYARSTKADHEFSRLKIDVVHGTFDELEKLTSLASEHDIVVNAASSEDSKLTTALVKGVSSTTTRKSQGVLIHVSGAGNFLDGGSSGNFNSDSKVWNDASVEDVSKIHHEMKNGACDKLVLDAGAAGHLIDFIVCPGGVYGQPNTDIPVATRGVFLEGMFLNCANLGYSPYIGDGTSVFPLSEVNDVVSLIMLVFDMALKGEGPKGPYQRYYNGHNAEKSWKEIATVFAAALHKKGKLQESTARQVPYDQAGILAGLIGANVLFKDDNAKAFGYRTQGPDISESVIRSI